ncbi:hypothetical protein [Planctomicrobium sp. SH664]|uniref:hypothetical protein n=1 Tax=Planctomicrobium sp. SH664 TaxID=3448125 RepID=UPI003F5CA042
MQSLPAWLTVLLNRFAINRAVGYLVAGRLWQVVTAPVTYWLIARYFSPTLQGYYYTFGSLVAMQVFAELGLSAILVLMASHEWSALQLAPDGTITGAPDAHARLANLHRQSERWLNSCALLFTVIMAVFGTYLLDFPRAPQGSGASPASVEAAELHWRAPWLTVLVLNSLSLGYLPRLSILEGCNQVGTINGVRLLQSITGSVVVWIGILSGAGLWVVAATTLVRLAWEWSLVHLWYGPFFRSLKQAPVTQTMSWSREIWPLQWKMAIQTILSFFVSKDFFVALAFRTQGPVLAGQIGFTWNILSTIQTVSLAWIQTRIPQFGMLAAAQARRDLNQQFLHTARIALGVFLLCSFGFWGAVWLLAPLGLEGFQARFMDLRSTAILIIALIALQVAMTEHYYVRLHKRDPFLILNVATGGIVAALFYYFGRKYGLPGALTAYAGYCWLITLPVSTLILLVYARQFDREARAAEARKNTSS